jgi:NAD(P)-dependent dehydrogenase (short-subunit alcohol dehydrogenase family)
VSDVRAVIVTGGTGALGRAVVEALLRDGARVAVPYRSEPAWRELSGALGSPAALLGRAADLTDAAATGRFVDEAVRWAGRLDGVAAIAGGYAGSAAFDAAPAGEWEQMLRANLEATRSICRAALPPLLQHRGSVVTVSSQLASKGGAGAAAYAVSKAAVEALTRVLALENETRGVRFNCVAPGTIDTPDNRRAMPDADVSRWTPAAAIAKVVVFLLSPDSAPVTGAVIPVHAAVGRP